MVQNLENVASLEVLSHCSDVNHENSNWLQVVTGMVTSQVRVWAHGPLLRENDNSEFNLHLFYIFIENCHQESA